MKVYVRTEEYDRQNILYGYSLYINDVYNSSFIGIANMNENDVTKHMLKKYNNLLQYDKLVTLKYEDIQTTKEMVHNINQESFYKELSNKGVVLMATPAVFLSDVQPFSQLKNEMNNYKNNYNYFAHKNNQKM